MLTRELHVFPKTPSTMKSNENNNGQSIFGGIFPPASSGTNLFPAAPGVPLASPSAGGAEGHHHGGGEGQGLPGAPSRLRRSEGWLEMAVGQTKVIPFWGRCTTHFFDSSGDWDAHWGYGILTSGKHLERWCSCLVSLEAKGEENMCRSFNPVG